MGIPYDYPIHDLWAKESCLTCGGYGAESVKQFEDGDYCDCIYDQLIHKADFIRLADGLIEVHHAE